MDDDLDQDGFVLAEDCDDNNIFVNPDLLEVPYNGLDDDCNETTLDDDLDQDGFILSEDCDDDNPEINIEAMEIPNNGIDEDCDGEDGLVSIKKNSRIKQQIFPNPASNKFLIMFKKSIEGTFELRGFNSQLLVTGNFTKETTVDVSHLPKGVYMLLLNSGENLWVERLMIN